MKIPKDIAALAQIAQDSVAERFREIDSVAETNTARVLEALHGARASDTHFSGTTGYGYNDAGRDVIDRVYAQVFGAESAIVRIGFVNGTHAIVSALFAAAEPGGTLLSVTGAPYDTLRSAITGDYGSLKYYGIAYEQIELRPDGSADISAIRERAKGAGAVFIQRSRGYSGRRALSVREIGDIADTVRKINKDAVIVVDNCYGEFTESMEPCHAGADIIAGSLIKNPGGGIAPAGGYTAGRADLVERAAQRLTSPGIGSAVGATLGQNRPILQGFFMAPHIVAQALKTSVFAAAILELLGYAVSPGSLDPRSDIIQAVELGTPERLKKFCAGIQAASPIDSFVTPEPWAMPGYGDPVVMAAGTFISGASIELSADAPLRPPYRVYLQGGLTYESAKLGIMHAIGEMMDEV